MEQVEKEMEAEASKLILDDVEDFWTHILTYHTGPRVAVPILYYFMVLVFQMEANRTFKSTKLNTCSMVFQ